MRLFWSTEAKRRCKLFRSIAKNLIAASQSSQYPSCENILLSDIDKMLDNSKAVILAYSPDHDYEANVIDVLFNLTFDLVTSGEYHLYAGILKPTGMQLRYICQHCLQRAVKYGTISDEQCNEQMRVLAQSIKNIG